MSWEKRAGGTKEGLKSHAIDEDRNFTLEGKELMTNKRKITKALIN